MVIVHFEKSITVIASAAWQSLRALLRIEVTIPRGDRHSRFASSRGRLGPFALERDDFEKPITVIFEKSITVLASAAWQSRRALLRIEVTTPRGDRHSRFASSRGRLGLFALDRDDFEKPITVIFEKPITVLASAAWQSHRALLRIDVTTPRGDRHSPFASSIRLAQQQYLQ